MVPLATLLYSQARSIPSSNSSIGLLILTEAFLI